MSGTLVGQFTKKARQRDTDGVMFIVCECGDKLRLDEQGIGGGGSNLCACGIIYDNQGWGTARPEVPTPEEIAADALSDAGDEALRDRGKLKKGRAMNCQGNHKLIVIFRTGHEDHEQSVVRWCSDCGAVVVDVDYDGRTAAGRLRKMQLPEISKVKAGTE